MKYKANEKTYKSLPGITAALYLSKLCHILAGVAFAGFMILGAHFCMNYLFIPYQYHWIGFVVILAIAAVDTGTSVFRTVRKAKRENKDGIIFRI